MWDEISQKTYLSVQKTKLSNLTKNEIVLPPKHCPTESAVQNVAFEQVFSSPLNRSQRQYAVHASAGVIHF